MRILFRMKPSPPQARSSRWPRRGKRLILALPVCAALLLAGCRHRGFPHYPSNYREYAWVTDGGGNSVTVLDLIDMVSAKTIPVGADPVAVAVNPKSNEVYVANSGSGTVSVIDAVTNRVTATIGVHRQPVSIDVNDEGTRAYVVNAGSSNVSVLDLAARREIATVGVGESPDGARISPDGNTLVVTNRGGNSVSIVDARTLAVRAVFTGCPQASDAVILPDSSKAFIACSGSHQVMAIGLARPKSDLAEEHADRLLDFLDVGPQPIHLALKPDGGEIFVSNFGSDTISEIATNNNEVGWSYMIGLHPWGGAVSADNSTLWVSNSGDNTVAAYSIDDGQRINTVQVGDGPGPLALSSDGFLLLAVDTLSGDVSVLRTLNYTPKGQPVTGSLFTVLAAGKNPNAIAVKSFRIP
jgi:YVTN family beta-propeller protein